MLRFLLEFLEDVYLSICKMRFRDVVERIYEFGMIVASALITWKIISILTGSAAPIVVILSGSMEPGMARGDLLLLSMPEAGIVPWIPAANAPLHPGDVIVFNIRDKSIPVVHRIMHTHRKPTSELELLTKGDANSVNDRGLYAYGELWLSETDVIGRAIAYGPAIGQLTILMAEHPLLKAALIGWIFVMVLLRRNG